MKMMRRLTALVAGLFGMMLAVGALAETMVAEGALTLNQLESWIRTMRQNAVSQQPLNTPVGEESLTADGYAFLFDDHTLYFEEPSAGSHLQAAVLTDAGAADPREICVGDDQAVLLAAYGWQNPGLMGDGTFAALYLENELPADARWAWAIYSGEELLSVQCAIHSALGDGQYTDMGIRYQLQGGRVERIEVYGLGGAAIAASDVLANLQTVSQLLGQLSGDDRAAEGRWQANDAAPFQTADLRFAGMDFLTLNDQDVSLLYGDPLSTAVMPDAEGLLYLTTLRDGLSIGYLESMDGTMVQAQSMTITTPMMEGPRGLRVGMPLEEALGRMRCDGSGQVLGSANLLYGDGQAAPYGLEESDGMGGTVLRYLCEAEGPNGLLTVTLYLSFQEDLLTEIYLYAW